MKLPIYQIDAFADAPFRGNPAAVCPLDTWLPDCLLQSIAEENNLSETAFYMGRDDEYNLRWFTPTKEVDLCGHATLAAAHVIFGQNPDLTRITFQSRSGPLRVSRDSDFLSLDFPAQVGERCDVPDNLKRRSVVVLMCNRKLTICDNPILTTPVEVLRKPRGFVAARNRADGPWCLKQGSD